MKKGGTSKCHLDYLNTSISWMSVVTVAATTYGISTNEIIIRTPIKSSFMLIKKVE